MNDTSLGNSSQVAFWVFFNLPTASYLAHVLIDSDKY